MDRAGENGLTEALSRVTAASPVLPVLTQLGTVCVRIVFVPDLVEEMDLGPIEEEGGTDTVNGSITPTLGNGG